VVASGTKAETTKPGLRIESWDMESVNRESWPELIAANMNLEQGSNAEAEASSPLLYL
jgi:hypothetical protein